LHVFTVLSLKNSCLNSYYLFKCHAKLSDKSSSAVAAVLYFGIASIYCVESAVKLQPTNRILLLLLL